MKINRKVVLVSENEELYKSFKRALKGIANIETTKYCGRFEKKKNVVINIMENGTEIDSWLWSVLRKRALNPLIVIGTEDKSSFMDKNPVFKNYPDEHAYIQIPFNLSELLKITTELKPIYNNITRRLIVNDYSKGYEYKLITHDLKIIKGDRNATIKNLLQVKDFYRLKGDDEIAKIIDEKVKEIYNKDGWEEVAWRFKHYLEERLEGRSKL